MAISLDKHSSLEDGWKESCDLRIGWMKQDKLQDFKKEAVISLDEHFSLGYSPEERGEQIDLLMDSPTKNELLKELKQCHKNLTNELLIKLMQSEDVSGRMKQLDEMVDIINLLEDKIKVEEVVILHMVGEAQEHKQNTDGLITFNRMVIYPLDGGAEKDKTSVLALEHGKEKHITEGLMNANRRTICQLDRGAEKDKTSVLALEQGKEKHHTEGLKNGKCMTIFHNWMEVQRSHGPKTGKGEKIQHRRPVEWQLYYNRPTGWRSREGEDFSPGPRTGKGNAKHRMSVKYF